VGWPEAEAVAVWRAVVVWRAMPVRSVVAVACFNFFCEVTNDATGTRGKRVHGTIGTFIG
jgi:hypothetical protein